MVVLPCCQAHTQCRGCIALLHIRSAMVVLPCCQARTWKDLCLHARTHECSHAHSLSLARTSRTQTPLPLSHLSLTSFSPSLSLASLSPSLSLVLAQGFAQDGAGTDDVKTRTREDGVTTIPASAIAERGHGEDVEASVHTTPGDDSRAMERPSSLRSRTSSDAVR